ncbi:hypothetical protein [Dietzia sp. 179-F 9C3 NHS]|uniref:hypothetical protein n=1 Tax=Dietzia sp. 179-F 9C3 NHS TaxID=3374295 RepID=UPI003879A68F
MPGSTSLYGLPYPVPGDPIADGANTVRALAEATEAAIASGGSGAQVVTSVNGATGAVTLTAAEVGAVANAGGITAMQAVTALPGTPAPNTLYVIVP